MTDTPTPLTDAIRNTPLMGETVTPHKWDMMTEHARSLERRLAEAQKRHEASHAEVLRLAEKLRKADPIFNSPMHVNAATQKPGYVSVPREPTDKVLGEGWTQFGLTPVRTGEIYKALLAAASEDKP